jgi:hypothetical protein
MLLQDKPSFVHEVENSQWVPVYRTMENNDVIKEYGLEEHFDRENKRLQLYDEWRRRKHKEKMLGKQKSFNNFQKEAC